MSTEKYYAGLTEEEVLASRKKHGANVLTPPQKDPLWKKFLQRFADPIIRILLVALLLSLAISVYQTVWTGESLSVFFEPVGILVAILLATVIGFVLELRNEKTFQSLNEVNDETLVKVRRGGNICQVMRKDIVVGDVVMLEVGEEIPADCRLLDSFNLVVNESSLTGEPQCNKTTDEARFDKEATYASNLVLKGTLVLEGYCTAEVIRVGDETESGKVFQAAQLREGEVTPLNRKLARLADIITTASYTVAIFVVVGRLVRYAWTEMHSQPASILLYFGGSLLLALALSLVLAKRQKKEKKGKVMLSQLLLFILLPLVAFAVLLNMQAAASPVEWIAVIKYVLSTVMIAVTLIVAAVPEGLPMSVTLSLAFSMKKLMKENVLPRTMHACETMGATNVICSDKTGTLTQNQMQVYEVQFSGLQNQQLDGSQQANLIAEAIAVNTTANLDFSDPEHIKAVGNPTEGALLLWLRSQNVPYLQLRDSMPIVDRLPFKTELKYMVSIVYSKTLGTKVLFVKGAPEMVMNFTSLSAEGREAVATQLKAYQRQAKRTIGFAYKQLSETDNPFLDGRLVIDGLTFMGIAAISDPVRADVPDAVRECIAAGIQVKIVTGDTTETAKEIGRQVGLWNDNDNERNTITGPEFADTSDEEIEKRLSDLKIMARARPKDKERLVRMLKRNNMVVAVTGDGTNDAPALNVADVGLSMGDGTAVAKEASDMTILDNSFRSITNAVMWGRSLYKNIQRFIMFQMAIAVSACLIVLVGAFLDSESPLTVTQMLWVNLIMDTFAALALASLPPTHAVMSEPPRHINDSIITRAMAQNIFGVGGIFFLIQTYILLWFCHTDVSSLMTADWRWGAADGLSPYELSLFFTIFVMMQFWNMFNAKAFMTGKSAFAGMTRSRLFMTVALMVLIGQVVIVSLGGEMFNVVPLHLTDWVVIIAATSVVLWIGEVVRLFSAQNHKK